LLLGQGLCVSPLKTDGNNGSYGPKSLAEVVRQVDNQKDLHEFILSHEGNPGAVASEPVKYERHPVSLLSAPIHFLANTFNRPLAEVVLSQPLLLRRRRNKALRTSACR
jgi:hypothetical protein